MKADIDAGIKLPHMISGWEFFDMQKVVWGPSKLTATPVAAPSPTPPASPPAVARTTNAGDVAPATLPRLPPPPAGPEVPRDLPDVQLDNGQNSKSKWTNSKWSWPSLPEDRNKMQQRAHEAMGKIKLPKASHLGKSLLPPPPPRSYPRSRPPPDR